MRTQSRKIVYFDHMRRAFQRKIAVACLYVSISFFGASQSELEKVKNATFERLIDYENDADLIHSDSNSITWFQADRFKFVRGGSHIRGVHRFDTLEISLRFEPDWTDSTISETKSHNAILIEKYEVKYLRYMDSIKWRGYKITKDGFLNDVVSHLKWKYPVDFSDQECIEIDAIRRLPNFVVGSTGVFLDYTFANIDPEEVQTKFRNKINFVATEVFETGQFKGDGEIYE